VSFFTLSPDRKSILYGTGDHHAWVAALDRLSPPRMLPLDDVTSEAVYLGASGRVYFSAPEGGSTYFFTMKLDGSDRRKVFPGPAGWRFQQISPDERWVTHGGVALPLAGGPPVTICNCQEVRWSTDGKSALFTFRALTGGAGVTVAVPLKAGEVFPSLPQGGFRIAAELAEVPGAIVIPEEFADVGPGMSSYVYLGSSSQQNIFQIPLQ
jgi:hypothetical protein